MNIENAKDQLLEIKRILDSLGITFWLIAGTLLAAIRDKDFFPWDHDMDISMRANDWTPELHKHFTHYFRYKPLSYGLGRVTVFDLNKTTDVRTNVMLEFYNSEYDVYVKVFPPMRDSFLTVIPAHYMDTPNYVDFIGERFRVPHKPEEVLENIYGDWRTPVKSGVPWKDRWGDIDIGKYFRGIR